MMEGLMKVTAFGEWNIYDDEKLQAEFVQAHFFVGDGEDLFKVLTSPAYKQGEKRSGAVEAEGQKKKKNRMYYYEKRISTRKARAVDEDLYEIPSPDLPFRHQITKNKKWLLVWKFWTGCLCLNNCIA